MLSVYQKPRVQYKSQFMSATAAEPGKQSRAPAYSMPAPHQTPCSGQCTSYSCGLDIWEDLGAHGPWDGVWEYKILKEVMLERGLEGGERGVTAAKSEECIWGRLIEASCAATSLSRSGTWRLCATTHGHLFSRSSDTPRSGLCLPSLPPSLRPRTSTTYQCPHLMHLFTNICT